MEFYPTLAQLLAAASKSEIIFVAYRLMKQQLFDVDSLNIYFQSKIIVFFEAITKTFSRFLKS